MAFTGVNYGGPQFNTGTDQSVRITRNDTNAQVVLGGSIDTMNVVPKYTTEMTNSIEDARVYHKAIPQGFEGTITVNRYNSDFETFIKELNARFYSKLPNIACTIVQTINNGFDNTQTQNTYTQCAIYPTDLGQFSTTKKVDVKISFSATEML